MPLVCILQVRHHLLNVRIGDLLAATLVVQVGRLLSALGYLSLFAFFLLLLSDSIIEPLLLLLVFEESSLLSLDALYLQF
jgi:hypothetical protein